MRRRAFVAGGLCSAALPLLGGCGMFGHTYPDYRYRLTVEVETPEGLRTGSSVIEVATGEGGSFWGPMAVVSHKLRGQAISVDLGKRGTLFVLLASPGNAGWCENILFVMTPPVAEGPAGPGDQDTGDDAGHAAFQKRFAAMLARKGRYDVPRQIARIGPEKVDNYPWFVRFGDPRDPASIARVDPDALDTAFGQGVRLKRVSVQLTDDPVTTGIEKRLTWLGPDPEPSLQEIPVGGTTRPTLGQILAHGDFKRNF